MGASRRASEVEEQTDALSILAFLQGCARQFEDKRLVGLQVMASLAEEVGVATVGELDSHLRTVVVRLHHHVEVISLRGAGGQLGINVELSLPLRASKAFRKCNLICVAAVGSLIIGNAAPAIVGEVVAEGIEQRPVIDGLPQVGTALIVPVHRGSVGIVGIAVRHHGTVVVGMVLQDDT